MRLWTNMQLNEISKIIATEMALDPRAVLSNQLIGVAISGVDLQSAAISEIY